MKSIILFNTQKVVLAGILVLVFLDTASQVNFNKDSLDEKMKFWIPGVTEKTPGYILAIIADGKVIYKTSKGSADIENYAPINENTIFNVGSISKQFTAFLILQLEQEGRLSTGDLASKYLPQYRVLTAHPIRISDLLHHTSGLREILEILELADGQNKYGYSTQNVEEILMNQHGLNFQPGEKYQYINTNYFLLGQIIEKITGKPYPESCIEKIFKPLNMTTAFVMDSFKKIVPNKAKAYIKKDNKFENATPMDEFYGANGMYFTINDLLLWTANLMTRQVGNEQLFTKFISKGTGPSSFYGYGLIIDSFKGLPVIGHNGGRLGYRAEQFYLPTKNLAIVALANYRSFPIANIPKIADYLLNIKGANIKIPPAAVLNPLPKSGAPVMTRYTGVYWSPGADLVRKVYVNKETLTYHRAPGNQSSLVFGGNNIFYIKLGDSLTRNHLYFPPKRDKWQMVSVSSSGDSTFFRQVDTATAGTVELDDYTGVFYCSEIHALLKIYEDDGQLVLKLKGWNEIILQQHFTDYFSNPEIGSFHFRRNKKNEIISVVYDSPRTRHLVYRKIERL